MNCIYCGWEYAEEIDPAISEDTKVFRWRKCSECGRRFETVEVPKEVYGRLEMRAANFQSMVSPESRAKAKEIRDRALINADARDRTKP